MFSRLLVTLMLSATPVALAQTAPEASAAAPAASAPAAAPAVPAASTNAVTLDAGPGDAEALYDVRLKQTDRRLSLGLFLEVDQFARPGGSLQGYSIDGLVSYAISQKYAAQFFVAQALTMTGGMSLLYTGFRLGPAYAVMGEFLRRGSNLTVDGRETVTVTPTDKPLLAIDVAADQYLFNGTARVVPATGISLGARYDRKMFGYPLSFMVRYGNLTVQSAAASVMTVGAGVLIPF